MKTRRLPSATKVSLALLVAVCLFRSATTAGQSRESLVLNGLPAFRVDANAGGANHRTLSEDESFEFRTLITKRGNEYVWASREGRSLTYSQSGIFHYFIEAGGAGYIKATETDGGVFYYEHVSLGLQTITYWGIAERLNP